MKRVIKYFSYNGIAKVLYDAFLGFLGGAVLYIIIQILVWIIYPYKTAEIAEPIDVTNPNNIVQIDQTLKMHLVINKESDITPVISRNLLCGDEAFYVDAPSTGGTARPQGIYGTDVEYELPKGVQPDSTCVFQFTNQYQVNPMRTITKVWRSETFKVKE